MKNILRYERYLGSYFLSIRDIIIPKETDQRAFFGYNDTQYEVPHLKEDMTHL